MSITCELITLREHVVVRYTGITVGFESKKPTHTTFNLDRVFRREIANRVTVATRTNANAQGQFRTQH